MKKHNQKGLGAVEALLIFVIVGLIAFVGWYVWHSKNQTEKSLANTSKISQISPTVHNQDISPQSSSVLKDYTFPSEGLIISYDKNKWGIEDEQSGSDTQCGKYATLQLIYAKNNNYSLGFEFGRCGKGGGICFYDGSPECKTESKELAKVMLTDSDKAYIVANRYSSDSGKTWTYQLALTNDTSCKGPCFYTAKNVESKPGFASSGFGDDTKLSITSLEEYINLGETQAALDIFKTAHY